MTSLCTPAAKQQRPPARASEVRQRSFTLIELLMVIAIIALLAGLLLAALNTARTKGLQATCLNNLHECFLASMAYTHDYEGFLPPNEYVYGPFGECPPNSWDRVLIERSKYISSPAVCFCPALEPDTYEPGRVYGSFLRDPTGFSTCDELPHVLAAGPTEIMLLVDSIRVSDLRQVWFFAHAGFGCWQRIHIRHQKLANVLLLDGHITTLGRGQLIGGTYKPVPEYKNNHWYVWPQED